MESQAVCQCSPIGGERRDGPSTALLAARDWRGSLDERRVRSAREDLLAARSEANLRANMLRYRVEIRSHVRCLRWHLSHAESGPTPAIRLHPTFEKAHWSHYSSQQIKPVIEKENWTYADPRHFLVFRSFVRRASTLESRRRCNLCLSSSGELCGRFSDGRSRVVDRVQSRCGRCRSVRRLCRCGRRSSHGRGGIKGGRHLSQLTGIVNPSVSTRGARLRS